MQRTFKGCANLQLFRDLYDVVFTRESRSLYWYVLLPWLEAHRQEIDWLHAVAARTESGVLPRHDWRREPPEDDVLFHLYPLSRANDTLLMRFQTGLPWRGHGHWEGPKISLDEYTDFMTGLGLRVVDPPAFSPFFYEIVEVEPSRDADASITLGGVYWPPLMLGRMLFSRGGAYVSGGRHHIRKEIAESSTMYWTYRRRCRPSHDLSRGWGSQSQWGTNIRADYQFGDTLIFNADGINFPALSGGCDLSAVGSDDVGHDGLTRSELIELVTHRCFITVDKPHDDLLPYGYCYTWTPRVR
jgi:hypothetical protein